MEFARLVGRLEQKVVAAQWEEALEILAQALLQPEAITPGGVVAVDLKEVQDTCTRFANAWGRLFAAGGWTLQDRHVAKLLPRLHNVHAIVHGGVPGNLDPWLLRFHEARAGRYDREAVARLVLLWVPNSASNLSPFSHLPHARAAVVAQALATIGGVTLCTPQADRARHAAIELLLSGNVTLDDLRFLSCKDVFFGAWMRCSYATHPRRHRVKTLLNASIRDLVGNAMPGLSATARREAGATRVDGKPVMLIPLEAAWGRNGAMRRCYAAALVALREGFHTVALGGTAELVEDGIVDRQVSWPNRHTTVHDVVAMARTVAAWHPSIVFYPSIGMDIGAVMLSNFRLAPLQVMALGHPATSCSPEIDYVLHEAGYVGDKSCYTEHIVEIPEGSIHFNRPLVEAPVRRVQPDRQAIRIAIPAVAQKISWPLIDTLRRLQRQVPQGCEFHFFTGLHGIPLLEANAQILAALPGAQVYPMLRYDAYMARLADCDLHLASFPFGGTNSVIDAFHLGVPVLALRGPEPHERVDAELVTRAGLADALVADDVEDLLARLVRFANDADWRERVSVRMRAAIASGDFLGRGDPAVYCERLQAMLPGGNATPAGDGHARQGS